MTAPAMIDERPALPWPYAVILIAELAILGRFVAISHGRPPGFYELGWAGVASMFAMQLYSVRRRVRALRDLGALAAWLDVHVFLGLQALVFVTYHSVGMSPQPSLAAINFALTATIVTTGLFGRYVYRLIPRARAEDAMEQAELRPLLLGPAHTAADRAAERRAAQLAARIAWLDRADRWCARWILLHRPLAFLLLGITTLHVIAHFAYAV